MICPSHVSLPNVTPELLLVTINLISKVSNPSVTLSQLTDTLALPSVAPALIVIVYGLELKSTPDPITVQQLVVDILTVNNHCLPIADTGDFTEGVTVTVIEVLDDPPVILTITSINPDDSEPTNCPEVNSTTNTTIVKQCSNGSTLEI